MLKTRTIANLSLRDTAEKAAILAFTAGHLSLTPLSTQFFGKAGKGADWVHAFTNLACNFGGYLLADFFFSKDSHSLREPYDPDSGKRENPRTKLPTGSKAIR